MENRDGRERATVGVAVLVITMAVMGCYRGGKGVPVTPEREDVACEPSAQRLAADGRLTLRVSEVSPRVLLGMQVKSEPTERGAALALTTTRDVDVADVRAMAIKIGDTFHHCCPLGLRSCCPVRGRIQAIELYEVPGGVKMEFVSLDRSQTRQLAVDLETFLIQMQEAIREQEEIRQ
jgi:hypothetical protein